MGFWDIFKAREPHNPEDDFHVTITELSVKVVLPKGKIMEIEWDKIQVIGLSNTDRGPWQPDIWLIMAGNGQSCVIPHGARGFDEVIERVSKFEGFDNHAVGLSMCCTENAEFILWGSKSDLTGFAAMDHP
jgi:hypothetical protein